MGIKRKASIEFNQVEAVPAPGSSNSGNIEQHENKRTRRIRNASVTSSSTSSTTQLNKQAHPQLVEVVVKQEPIVEPIAEVVVVKKRSGRPPKNKTIQTPPIQVEIPKTQKKYFFD